MDSNRTLKALSLGMIALTVAVVMGCAPADSPAPAEPIELVEGDAAELQAIAEKARGKVVLVDFWATWCRPCMQQFPHTVELAKRHANDGLEVISVSMDDLDEKEAALAFLQRQGANFTNLQSRDGGAQESYEAFGIKTGQLPYYVVIDRSGKRHELSTLAKDPEKGLSPEELDEHIDRFLAEKTGS